MIDKRCYTLRCTGSIEGVGLAKLLKLFQQERINIRHLTLLPHLDPLGHKRLEIQFELPAPQSAFIEHLKTFVLALPDVDPVWVGV